MKKIFRQILAGAVSAALFALTLEAGAFLIFKLGLVAPFDPFNFRQFYGATTGEATHPFLSELSAGRAAKDFSEEARSFARHLKGRQYFNESLPPEREPGTFVLALSGNSVMESIYGWDGARDLLRTRLAEKIPALRGREIRILNLSQHAFKQPQQAIASLLYQDHFDALINLDGYNEVAPSVRTMAPSFYPMIYSQFQIVHDDGIGHHFWSFCRQVYRRAGSALLESRLDAPHSVRLALVAARSLLTYFSPAARYVTHEKMNDVVGLPIPFVTLWEQGIRSQAAILRAAGKPAWFFLQPNLHHEGSKPWSALEKEFRRQADMVIVRTNYPKLVEASQKLKAEGVRMFDLTQVFQGVDEDLYKDPCCHVNERGKALLVEAMVEAVAKSWPADYEPAHLRRAQPARKKGP